MKYPEEYSTIYHKRLHQCWYSMRTRCDGSVPRYNERYHDRGIDVCDEWQYWPNFAEWALNHGYAGGLEIDRIDNNKGYHPDNCRFVTDKVQTANRDLPRTYAKIRGGQTRHWAKEFICVETGDKFLTQIEAARHYKLDRKGLRYALSGKYSQCGGYTWRYISPTINSKEAITEVALP